MTFYVGQKVVCVDAAPRYRANVPLRKGAIYTIRGFTTADDGQCGVLLDEAIDPSGYYRNGQECGFFADRFRPIVDRKSSVSFTMGAPKDSERWDNRKRVKVRS